jgi:hypothetical protein
MINKVTISERAKKDIKKLRHLLKIINKCNKITVELKSNPTGGSFYRRHGERLTEVEKKYKNKFEIHSIALNEKLRFVYEIYENINSIDILVTDVNNHKHRGIPYYDKNFSDHEIPELDIETLVEQGYDPNELEGIQYLIKCFNDKQYSTNEQINKNLNNKRKMNLELNLVKTQSIHARVSSLIARKRVKAENTTEAMEAITAFIADNMITINAAITDRALTSQLSDLKSLTVDELYSLKYILASNGGIDLIIVNVADLEVNEFEIPKDIIEYNVIDNLRAPLNFIKWSTKVPLSNKGNLTELYKTIIEMYGLFEGNLFTGSQNPLEYQLGVLQQTEMALGITPSAITTYLNGVLEYLGKDIYVIMP